MLAGKTREEQSCNASAQLCCAGHSHFWVARIRKNATHATDRQFFGRIVTSDTNLRIFISATPAIKSFVTAMSLDPHEAILAPVGSPGITDFPVILRAVGSVAHQKDGVVHCCILLAPIEDAPCIDGPGLSVYRHHDRSFESQGMHQGLELVLLKLHEALGLQSLMCELLAFSIFVAILILFFADNAVGGCEAKSKLSSGPRAAAIATAMLGIWSAIQHVLEGELRGRSHFVLQLCMHLQGTHCSDCPAGPTRALLTHEMAGIKEGCVVLALCQRLVIINLHQRSSTHNRRASGFD
mmetsp:Transcript_58284/g.103509  ORF Transcript_58284/g.103509 Transcript_58284/m.103509 type:complete len:296 (-) Transcript_58284:426-1313(-)